MSTDVSVVITVHAEGRILLPTLRSISAACDAAVDTGLSVEVILVLDRIDDETRRVVTEHALPEHFRSARLSSIEVDNGDLGMSRNAGIAASTGAMVAVLDGDNLVTRNWIAAAAAALVDRPDAVAHPAHVITFGARTTWWALGASDAPDFREELLATVNPWDACVIARREVMEAVPYLRLPPGEGFGPEDWAWNMETLERGYVHVVVPRTALFYRVRPDSLMSAHGRSLLPRVSYLSSPERAMRVVARYGAVPAGEAATFRGRIRRVVPFHVRRPVSIAYRGTRSVVRPWVAGARRVISRVVRSEQHSLPGWVIDDWRAANQLEPSVPFPRPHLVNEYERWGHPWEAWDSDRAVAYWRLLAAIGADVDFLFLAPWVRTGGGDRVLLQYIGAVRRLRPDARVVLLTTEEEPSTRLSDVPDGVSVVELRRYLTEWTDREWVVENLLPQLLVQVQPRTIHAFNSTIGYDVIERYGRVLSANIAIYLSTFVLDRTPDGERTSVLFYRHPRFLEPIQGVLVDSEAFAQKMAVELGFPREKFVVQRQITHELPAVTRPLSAPFGPDRPMRVLWAGRFDLQKRLDILADVVEEARRRGLPVSFEYFGEPVMGYPHLGQHLQRLEEAGALRHGPYADITHLELERFGAFIMTSEWEGVPNTLLEVMSAGVPVIAPDVGGVGEVLDDAHGYLVDRFDDAGGYVDALEAILSDPDDAHLRGDRARARVHDSFSVDAFDAGLAALPAYLDGLRFPAPTEPAPARADVEFLCDAETARFLRSRAPRTYLFSGGAGFANFGDVLQAKNIVRLWARHAAGVERVLFFHADSVASAEELDELRRDYACEYIVFFRSLSESLPDWLELIDGDATPPGARLHVIGGGYLNAAWGAMYLEAIKQVSEQFRAGDVLFSGMQIDEMILPALAAFDGQSRVISFGTRDEDSLERAQRVFGRRAAFSFDDVYEVFAEWARAPKPSRDDGPFRLGLHMNASEYVGGKGIVEHVQQILQTVLARYPDTELTVLNAYDDTRSEVADSVATLRLFGSQFPFSRFRVLDLARTSLHAQIGDEVPQEIASLDLDAAITCSYHTTMLLHTLGIPAFLVRLNAYYDQKSRIFDLPDDFGAFLAEPQRFLATFEEEAVHRAEWRAKLSRWMIGERDVFGGEG